jgi:hypothetical protein
VDQLRLACDVRDGLSSLDEVAACTWVWAVPVALRLDGDFCFGRQLAHSLLDATLIGGIYIT